MEPHRSFRLRSGTGDDPDRVGWSFILVQQLIVLGLAGLILDGGRILQIVSYAAVAYWVCVGIILVRRRRGLTRMDRMMIRTGFMLACAISVFLTLSIWHLRGV